jgi:hypothetical protein
MHKSFNENTICLSQIIDRLFSYIPTNFQELSLRKMFHLFEKLTLLENRHQIYRMHTNNFKPS